jgi:hypothetical protein
MKLALGRALDASDMDGFGDMRIDKTERERVRFDAFPVV